MVFVLEVFAKIVDHEVPPSCDLSILYPLIAEPPLSDGAVQLRLIREYDIAVAVSPLGAERPSANAFCTRTLIEKTRIVAKTRVIGLICRLHASNKISNYLVFYYISEYAKNIL